MSRGAVFALALLVSVVLGSRTALSHQWSRTTASPQRGGGAAHDAPLHALCGPPERSLATVAAAVVARRVSGRPSFDHRQLQALARAAGSPHPAPRAWLISGSHDDTAARLARWMSTWSRRASTRRCGIARGSAGGEPVTAIVAVEALADLSAVPRRARRAQWLALDALVHVPAEEAKVVLLGPRGRPRRVLTSLSDGQVRSRFALDQPGRWLVQVLAVLESGPEPLLEAEVFVDSPPPARLDESPQESKPAPSLGSLLNRARRAEGLARLRRDATLDAIAREHALAMLRAGRVAHDVGHGGPDERVDAAGARVARVGENLARAPTVTRLHRALWDSPSHRDNMLDPEFERVGIAIAKDAAGRLWAVQLFAR